MQATVNSKSEKGRFRFSTSPLFFARPSWFIVGMKKEDVHVSERKVGISVFHGSLVFEFAPWLTANINEIKRSVADMGNVGKAVKSGKINPGFDFPPVGIFPSVNVI